MDGVSAVKERLSIEDVVSEYVALKRAGRNYKGLCPFHSEKTPSFMVNPERSIYHCFGCNEGGDILAFVMKLEGYDFPQALEHLARKAGVDLEQYQKGRGSGKEKDKYLKILELAVRYYQSSLLQNAHAIDYVFKERGINKKTATDFAIGYAPNSGNALLGFMKKRGYNQSDLKNAGLLTGKGDKDLFRGRVLLTLADSAGRPIGFTGRILSEDAFGPKYLNSPQSLIYDKSRHIYGLHLAKNAIRKTGVAVLVEGNMDVVSSHQAGVKNVVATAGTAMTVDQLKQLSRLADTVILAFDNDAAGLNATIRAIGLAQKVDVALKVAPITGGKDPDDIIRADVGKWEKMIDSAEFAIDWLINVEKEKNNLNTGKGKKDFAEALVPVIEGLRDGVEREHYQKKVAGILDVSVGALTRKSEVQKSTKIGKRAQEQAEKSNSSALSDIYLSLLLRYPETRVSMADSHPKSFDERRSKVWKVLKENAGDDPSELFKKLNNQDNFVKILLFKAEELYGSWESSERTMEAIDMAQRLGYITKQKQLKEITEALKRAEDEGNDAEAKKLLSAYQALLREE